MDKYKMFMNNVTNYLLTYPQIWLQNNMDFLNKEWCIDWSTMLLVTQRCDFELEIDISAKKEEYERVGLYGVNYGYRLTKSEIELYTDNLWYESRSNNTSIICTIDDELINAIKEVNQRVGTLSTYDVWFRFDNRRDIKQLNLFQGGYCVGLHDNCRGLHINYLYLTPTENSVELLDSLSELDCTYSDVCIEYSSRNWIWGTEAGDTMTNIVKIYQILQKRECLVHFNLQVMDVKSIERLLEELKREITGVNRWFDLLINFNYRGLAVSQKFNSSSTLSELSRYFNVTII